MTRGVSTKRARCIHFCIATVLESLQKKAADICAIDLTSEVLGSPETLEVGTYRYARLVTPDSILEMGA